MHPTKMWWRVSDECGWLMQIEHSYYIKCKSFAFACNNIYVTITHYMTNNRKLLYAQSKPFPSLSLALEKSTAIWHFPVNAMVTVLVYIFDLHNLKSKWFSSSLPTRYIKCALQWALCVYLRDFFRLFHLSLYWTCTKSKCRTGKSICNSNIIKHYHEYCFAGVQNFSTGNFETSYSQKYPRNCFPPLQM